MFAHSSSYRWLIVFPRSNSGVRINPWTLWPSTPTATISAWCKFTSVCRTWRETNQNEENNLWGVLTLQLPHPLRSPRGREVFKSLTRKEYVWKCGVEIGLTRDTLRASGMEIACGDTANQKKSNRHLRDSYAKPDIWLVHLYYVVQNSVLWLAMFYSAPSTTERLCSLRYPAL